MVNDKELPTGQQRPSTTWGEYNNIGFVIQQFIGKLQTATLVRVENCTNSGGLEPVGFVDITPLVNQIDAAGNPTPHVTIFNVPYFRYQGGKNAVIIDPEKGDIGLAVFASRDISKVKGTKDAANPGSLRQYSFSDAMYVGGLLNAAPDQYVQFSAAGIRMHSPVKIKLDAPTIEMAADSMAISCQTFTMSASSSATVTTPTFTVNGNIVATGDVTGQGTSLHGHRHASTPPGNPTSPPL